MPNRRVRRGQRRGDRSLVPASRLVPPGLDSPLDIDDYAWSDDGRRLLIFTNTRKVWRQNTRGDYWVLDVGTVDVEGRQRPGSARRAPSSRRACSDARLFWCS